MSAKRYPKWLPPVAFVAAVGAIMFFSNQPAIGPDGTEAIVTLGQYAQCQQEANKLSLDAVRRYEAGETLSKEDLEGLRKSIALFNKMNVFQPTKSSVYFIAGKIHRILGENEIALERFDQCILNAPIDAQNNPMEAKGISLTAAEASFQTSQILLTKQDFEGSLHAADEAVKAVPDAPLYLIARARALIEMRRLDDAKKDLKTVLALDPENRGAQTLLKFISK